MAGPDSAGGRVASHVAVRAAELGEILLPVELAAAGNGLYRRSRSDRSTQPNPAGSKVSWVDAVPPTTGVFHSTW